MAKQEDRSLGNGGSTGSKDSLTFTMGRFVYAYVSVFICSQDHYCDMIKASIYVYQYICLEQPQCSN